MKVIRHKLGELLRVSRGASLPGTGYSDSGEYLRLTLANFKEEGGFKEFKSTAGKFFVEPFDPRFLMHKGDLITPLTEQSPGLLGSVAYVPCDGLYIQSQDVGLISCDPKMLDKHFAYYLFLTRSVREQISARSQQTKIRHTSPGKIADVEVDIPDLPSQLRIAGVLGSIDEKIELNRKKIAELEALAKTIYDYWFVQFDFPDANGKPYKSSGGKMVWNEQLKRKVPEGWEVVSLGEIANFSNGINYTNEDRQGKQYRILNVRDISASTLFIQERNLSEITLPEGFAERYVIPKDSIIVARSGIPGAIRLISNARGVLYCGFVIVCRPKNADARPYLTYYMKSLEGSGATHKDSSILNNVSQDMLKRIIIPMPDNNTLQRFRSLMEDIFSSIVTSHDGADELISIRDALLPLLMNGQVEVAG